MVIILFIISAIGLVGLTICIIKLVSPFVGWHCKYEPSTTEMAVDVPKAGRYSINIRRDRFWLWKGYGTVTDAFPKVNFSIKKMITGEKIQYFPSRSLVTSKGTGKMSVFTGYFDAPTSDRYLITSLPESRFLEKDEIWIRKHLAFMKLFLLIWGIVLSSFLFLGSLILGILMQYTH
jgi:IS1 family transposase